ncbi:MAG: hypothetical protein Q6364_08320 [Candidatus Hermodarchaeota archaeon]|nr:hypothetical protein [Candidatus Hermodarchaeota archaeon]
MQNSFNSLAIVILIIFFIELLIARRIYRNSRKNNQLRSNSQNQMYVVFQPTNNWQGTIQQNTINGRPIPAPQQPVPQYILAQPQQPPVKSLSTRFTLATFVGSVFLIAFLTISYLLRPFTNAWGIYLLPILLPLPFLALPSLLQSKKYSTFFFLISGLGLGFLFMLLL